MEYYVDRYASAKQKTWKLPVKTVANLEILPCNDGIKSGRIRTRDDGLDISANTSDANMVK